MQKKQLTLVIVSLLVVVLSVSLAYFTAQIIGKGKDVSVSSADLKIIFTDTDGSIEGSNITPGWSNSKTFTIKNDTKTEYKYNIVIKDLLNTFVTEGYLQYKITSINGGYNMTEFKDIPKSSAPKDTILAYSVSIPVGVTQSYTIEFKYVNDESVDQSEDMGKTLSGTLFITEGTEQPTLLSQILNDNPTRDTRNTYNAVFTNNTTGTLFTATEKNIHNTTDTTVYYYAGNTTNNWVKFGKFQNDLIRYRGTGITALYGEYSTMDECTSVYSKCTEYKYANTGDDIYWRIIRTNSDGSVRLLYHGTSTTTTEAYIGTSAFNTTYNNPMYVGYMYGTSGSLVNNRANTNNSTIKGIIDTWYENNLKTNYTKYLSTTAVYCNDRSNPAGGYNTDKKTEFYYGGYTRLGTNKTPTYDCTNVNDKFTVDTSTGNGKLTYPIALMTADEVSFAGGVYFTSAETWYYKNSAKGSSTGSTYWWLLSPHSWNNGSAEVFLMSGSSGPGDLGSVYVFINTHGVRPVISLKSCVKTSGGDGSASDPYTIKETTSGC